MRHRQINAKYERMLVPPFMAFQCGPVSRTDKLFCYHHKDYEIATSVLGIPGTCSNVLQLLHCIAAIEFLPSFAPLCEYHTSAGTDLVCISYES